MDYGGENWRESVCDVEDGFGEEDEHGEDGDDDVPVRCTVRKRSA